MLKCWIHAPQKCWINGITIDFFLLRGSGSMFWKPGIRNIPQQGGGVRCTHGIQQVAKVAATEGDTGEYRLVWWWLACLILSFCGPVFEVLFLQHVFWIWMGFARCHNHQTTISCFLSGLIAPPQTEQTSKNHTDIVGDPCSIFLGLHFFLREQITIRSASGWGGTETPHRGWVRGASSLDLEILSI